MSMKGLKKFRVVWSVNNYPMKLIIWAKSESDALSVVSKEYRLTAKAFPL